ncbi:MAG: poly-beta-1,6-N-acetyl-D-glucosamine N-deacetylase, partial [Hafnia sp.]
MLKRCLWLSALIAGWLMITACSSAHNTTPRYVPPAERTPLTADHPWPKNSFLVLGYHDVEDGAADQRYLSVRTSALSDQMAWLRDNGYNPISVQQ